jgi:hypothetical protein
MSKELSLKKSIENPTIDIQPKFACIQNDEKNSLKEFLYDSFKKYSTFLIKVSLFIICCYCCTDYSNNPKQLEYIHTYSDVKFLYFTNQSLYFTVFTLIISFIDSYRLHISEIYNILLPISITLETIVTAMFWSLYFIDRKLIVNKNFLRAGYETPLLTELGVHLFPLILLIIDQIGKRFEKSKARSMFLSFYLILWGGIIVVLGNKRGKYLYPFMNLLPGDFVRIPVFIAVFFLFHWICKCYVKLKTKHSLSRKEEISSKTSLDIKIKHVMILLCVLSVTAILFRINMVPLKTNVVPLTSSS